ncbi:MAG: HEAT repeat domain-containing protein [Gammaproteobacteria bacterium]|nr:MAG: HEAT repeat domain-containing protein [Gammaproteobacteria bacterium]
MTPDARLLVAPGCPHCPTMIRILSDLVKEGLIGRLEIINIQVHPEAAAEAGTRSVPWFRIGDFEFTGAHGEAEVRSWAEKAATGSGEIDYLLDLIEQRRLDEVQKAVEAEPELLCQLIERMADPDMSMVVRIGISALVEGWAGRPELAACLPAVEVLSRSDSATVRGDAAHFLEQLGTPEARSLLEGMREDPDPQVRELVRDALGSDAVAE